MYKLLPLPSIFPNILFTADCRTTREMQACNQNTMQLCSCGVINNISFHRANEFTYGTPITIVSATKDYSRFWSEEDSDIKTEIRDRKMRHQNIFRN